MPQIAKHRRFKRATVLIKRTQCLGKYPRNRGCMPSYEKLRSNNSCLARALSKQKQKGQLLFTQNVALLAEVQDLSSACNKRDNTLLKVLQNAKEMLKMLVTMSKFVTSTISSCQEFASSSNASLRMSCNSFMRGDDRRLSARSPTKGVVKPMISGHTITKPSINLSRINMRHINNPSNLTTIEEVSPSVTSVENSDVNNDSSSSSAIVPVRQARNANGRACRMPERLNISSPRVNEDGERRSSQRKSRHSEQLSRKRSRSKSNKLLESSIERRSTERTELIGSPRVKLNDVSKLLHNCQTINIRRLGSIHDDFVNESLEINDSTNNTPTKQNKDNIVSETEVSMDLTRENSYLEDTNDSEKSNDEFTENNRKVFTSEKLGENIQINNRNRRDNVFNLYDPLEGSSWMFNNSQKKLSMTNIKERASVKGSNRTSRISQSVEIANVSSSSEDESYVKNEKELNGSYSKKSTVKSRTLERDSILNNVQENYDKIEDDCVMNIQGFVTRQRGNSTEAMDDDLDDFTLMYRRQPINNIPFDINDLRLPVLEDSVIKSVVTKEPEPEITTTLQKITQNCLISSTSDDIKDESLLDNSTVKLPLLSNTAIDCTVPVVDIALDTQQQQKLRKTPKIHRTGNSLTTTPSGKKNRKQRKKSKNDKDPSAAKVVLQKLNESHVKMQNPLLGETFSQNSSTLSRKNFNLSSLENSSDSESSTAGANLNAENAVIKRPRRQKAPQNLKEPSLTKKLRRLE
ncbi:hypothetical protein KPH14_003704 [Odynerus spinipes]|uniref:Shugoshin C-terminal domain-containing protein n=1 Tax=Odynerus spinipes TaxID=1348599 RepID=A0AAD9RX87_9HYME|nr:hypothetical protein KPH14_003704 [Odynerus spinipes]